MAKKMNCWEFKKCGRELDGSKSSELGTCPAAEAKSVDGIHGGSCGGRACWVIAGTFCGNAAQGAFASKIGNCLKCDFYKKILEEEGLMMDRIDILYAMKTSSSK